VATASSQNVRTWLQTYLKQIQAAEEDKPLLQMPQQINLCKQ
jgi:hypothetical protein